MGIQNTIEQAIVIKQAIEAVWTLVEEPGWWINEGQIRAHKLEQKEGYTTVTDPKHGAFHLETVEKKAPNQIVYRWLSQPEEKKQGALETLVIFLLETKGENATELRVRESGFLSGEMDEAERRKAYQDNVQGWGIELAAAKTHLEQR